MKFEVCVYLGIRKYLYKKEIHASSFCIWARTEGFASGATAEVAAQTPEQPAFQP